MQPEPQRTFAAQPDPPTWQTSAALPDPPRQRTSSVQHDGHEASSTDSNPGNNGESDNDSFLTLFREKRRSSDFHDKIHSNNKKRMFKFMMWNIQGLKNKLMSFSFKKYCEQFQIFAFAEIWFCKKEDIENAFPNFKVFFAPRSQRMKGGVAVCVCKTISDHAHQLLPSVEDGVFLKFEKRVLQYPFDVIFAFVYVAPERSVIYGEENPNGIDKLADNVAQIMQEHPDLPWVLCGDFNARTGELSDTDSIDEHIHAQPLNHLDELLKDMPQTQRKSKDSTTNKFGVTLIELLKENDMFIMNGRSDSDRKGEITCVANRGKSVVDYVICSKSMLEFFSDMYVANRSESDHFPIVTSLEDKTEDDAINENTENNHIRLENRTRFKITNQGLDVFSEYLHKNLAHELTNFLSAVSESVDAATEHVISFMQKAAEKMWSEPKRKFSRDQPLWWDRECEEVKREKYKALSNFRHTNDSEDLKTYINLKSVFKSLCKSKREEQDTRVLKELNEACNEKNSKSFWGKVRSLTTHNSRIPSTITPGKWFEYFRNILSTEQTENAPAFEDDVSEVLHRHCSDVCEKCHDFDYDCEISETEIQDTIKEMKKGTAAGPDGLPSDLFHKGTDVLVKFLHPLFNKVYSCGQYPESWTKAMIYPLHKKGHRGSVDNYRSISLLNVLSKIYNTIINKRLSKFCDENDIIPEAQAGFRKGYSTTDNIFTLQSLVQKYLTKQRGRFYTLFVDFSKAFDCVNRSKLLYLLLSKGIHGKMFSTLQGMYKRVMASVCVGDKITEYFDCMSGVRQGCVLSPLLFSIFLSELQTELVQCGAQGIDILGDPLGVFLLMYADDIAIVSDSVLDLQKKINCLEEYCRKWGLKVNMDKTKVVVFKNGGFIKRCEKWFFNSMELKVESCYSYLGVIFSTTLKWNRCVEALSSKALRALAGIRKLYFKLKQLPVDMVFKMFDVKIKPILLYGSEIWGFQKYEAIEKIQIKLCKMVLGVGRDVKNSIALGECGRLPIVIDTQIRLIKYWCRLVNMPSDRYPKQCYNMLYSHDSSGRKNWVSEVRVLLCKYGFGYVWVMQHSGDIHLFIEQFKSRVKDMSLQLWHDSVSSEEDYCLYQPELIRANYITCLDLVPHRRALCLLRCNRLHLNGIPRFGYLKADPHCKQCDGNQVEDLLHFLLVCPKYMHLRKKFLPLYYHRFPNTLKVQLLCQNMRGNLAMKTALYIVESMKIRG